MIRKIFLLVIAFILLQESEGKHERPPSRIRCPPLPILLNGRYKVTGRFTVEVVCDDSFMYESSVDLSNDPIISCQNGKWTDPNPSCVVVPLTCDPPKELENGYINGIPPYEEESTIRYSCNEGYVLDGNDERRCQPSVLQWTGSDPVCVDQLQKLASKLNDKVKEFQNASLGRIIGYDVEVDGLDLFLVFDKSSSIHPSAFTHGIEFAKHLVGQFNVSNGDINKKGGTRIAVITFGDKQKEEISLTDTTISSTKIALERLSAIKCDDVCDGSTNMQAALGRVEFLIRSTRKNAKKALFITSDGIPNASDGKSKSVDDYAKSIKDKNVEIYTIGIGHDIDEYLLQELASSPHQEHYFLLKKFPDFSKLVKLMREESKGITAPTSPGQCGFVTKADARKRNYNSNLIKAGSNPWLAAITKIEEDGSSNFICSGALVCGSWVLTSAQCLHNGSDVTKAEELFVVLGVTDLSKFSGNEQYFYVEEVIIQDEFELNRNRIDSDMALIKLKGVAKFTDFVRPICVPANEDLSTYPDSKVQMVGWLTTSEESIRLRNKMLLNTLRPRVVELEVLSIEDCKRDATFLTDCTDSNIGASIGGQFSKDCITDHGSLVVAEINGRHNLIGVVSRAEGCKLDQKFVVYTRTKYHTDWMFITTKDCTKAHA